MQSSVGWENEGRTCLLLRLYNMRTIKDGGIMKLIVEEEFWKFIESKENVPFHIRQGLKNQYGTTISQSIREINYQISIMDKASQKMSNLLKSPFGKMILMYLARTDEDFKFLLKEDKR